MNKNITHPNFMVKNKILLLFAIVFFSALIFKLPRFIESNFGDISLEQLIYHVLAEHDGMPRALVMNIVNKLIFLPFLFSTLIIFTLWCIHRFLPYICFKFSKAVLIFAIIYAQIFGFVAIYYVLNIDTYLQANFHTSKNLTIDWMKQFYQHPSAHYKKSAPPKNLIVIYVESLENFRVNSDSILRKDLNSFNIEHFSIQPGTQWTLAGIVASQCGVPLLPVGLIASHGLMETKEPLKNAICLGDILMQSGYYNEFIGGADPEFSGKGTFLKKHGFDQITGKHYLDKLYPKSKYPSDWWGHSDETVLNHAKQRVVELNATKKPFFLNILTLDTHANTGHLSEYCKKLAYTDSVDQIFQCTVLQIEGFYNWLNQNNYLDNTVLVIMGDHPFMSKDYRGKFGGSKFRDLSQKDIFFGMKLPDNRVIKIESMTHFDIYPTVLSSLDYQIENDGAGIGKNMFSKEFQNMSNIHSKLPNQLRRSSPDYLELWRD
ncbi:MdoB Phosphoglycerol transferase and related proteins, alkaline phosphatase superfamily [Methylophilaceae bacterium]